MKLNKNKAKAKNKVHPSPFSPSSSSSTPLNDPIKTLKLLLPSTILTLISSLSLSDSQVLAYMLLHSLKSSTITEKYHKKNSEKVVLSHCFECDCFGCYTSYWYRWDLSPNRELIHQAIEAFEEHLTSNEVTKKGKRKEKSKKEPVLKVGIVKDPILQVGFVKDPILEVGIEKDPFLQVGFGKDPILEVGIEKDPFLEVGFEKDPILEVGFEKDSILEVGFENGWDPVEKRVGFDVEVGGDVEEREICGGGGKLVLGGEEHRGLARKMLPDVIGLFNSRLWNLWGPNA